MRVPFLTSRMPYPPVGGDRFRVFHFIRALELGERGRDWVRARFSWDHAYRAFEAAAGST